MRFCKPLEHESAVHMAELDASSTQSSPVSATLRVYATIELLEAILIWLPLRDLLLAQRITRHVKHVIETSVNIQRKLYLLPEPVDLKIQPVTNPFFTADAFAKRTLVATDSTHTWRVPALDNPTEHFDGDGATGYYLRLTVYTIPRKLKPSTSAPVDRQTLCHSVDSWQRMLLTQPPCRITGTFDYGTMRTRKRPRKLELPTCSATAGNLFLRSELRERAPESAGNIVTRMKAGWWTSEITKFVVMLALMFLVL